MKSFLKAHVHQNCFAQASQGIQGRFGDMETSVHRGRLAFFTLDQSLHRQYQRGQ